MKHRELLLLVVGIVVGIVAGLLVGYIIHEPSVQNNTPNMLIGSSAPVQLRQDSLPTFQSELNVGQSQLNAIISLMNNSTMTLNQSETNLLMSLMNNNTYLADELQNEMQNMNSSSVNLTEMYKLQFEMQEMSQQSEQLSQIIAELYTEQINMSRATKGQ
jgi:TolA-binding protein